MKKVLFSLIFLLSNFSLFSQDCSAVGYDFYNHYDQYYGFWDDYYQIRPTVKIKVNFIIPQDDNGQNNYQNNATDRDRLNFIIDGLNNRYAHNQQPSDSVYLSHPAGTYLVPFLESTKIQFELDSIYFYQDSAAHVNGVTAHNLHLSQNPDAHDKVSIIFTHYLGAAGNAIEGGNKMIINFRWMDTITATPGQHDQACINVLGHEMGHFLGIHHTYDGTEGDSQTHPEYLKDVFNTGSLSTFPHASGWDCPVDSIFQNSCTNNIMGGTKTQTYFSPMQIYRMHKRLSLDETFFKYILCEDYGDLEPILIYDDQTIDFKLNIFNPITVLSGSELKIRCELIMAKNQKIKVEPNASLELIGGKITSTCGYWNGIELQGDYTHHQASTTQTYNPQPLVYSANGIIENATSAIKTYCTDHNGTIEWGTFGGIFHIENTSFVNNWKSIEVMSYQNFAPDTSILIPYNNISYVYNSNFDWDSSFINPSWIPQCHISIWDSDGIKIHGNTFNNSFFENVNDLNKLNGIFSIDASLDIREHNSTGTIGGIITNSYFNNLNVGIQASSPSQMNVVSIKNITFNDNHVGAYILGSDFAELQLNTFNIGEGFVNNEGGQGIRIEGGSSLNIEENTFSHSGNTNGTGGTVGIYSINADIVGPTTNSIYRNTFSNLQRSVQLSNGTGPFGNPINPNTGNTMTHIDCNTFNDSAVYYNDYASIYKFSGALGQQGECLALDDEAPQVNLFQGDYDASQNRWQALNFGTTFSYNSYPFGDVGIQAAEWYSNPPYACVSVGTYDYDDACPSNFVVLPPFGPGLTELQDVEEGLSSNFLSSQEILDLINKIKSDDSDYSKEIALIEKSPYLTDAILKEMVNSNLANYRKRNILNLHYPVSDEVISNMINSPYPIAPYILRDAMINSAGVNESILIQYFKDNEQPSWAIAEVAEANSPLTDNEMLSILGRNQTLEPYRLWKFLQWNTPLSSEVMNALLSLDPPTAEWVINKINSSVFVSGDPSIRAKQTKSPLEILKEEYTYVKSKKWNLLNRGLRELNNNYNINEMISLLEIDNTLESKVHLLPLTIENDPSKFTNTISDLRSVANNLFILDPKDEKGIHISVLCDYYEMLATMKTRNGDVFNLEESEANILADYAISEYSISGKAKGLMNLLRTPYKHHIMEPLKFINESKKMIEVLTDELIENENDFIVYPNPNNGNFILQGQLPDGMNEGVVEFTDLSGRLVKTILINGDQIRKVIHLGNANGIYLYEISSVNKIVSRGKIIVQN